MPSFRSKQKYVTPGESGTAAVVSRPDEVNHGNALYLKERLDAVEAGKALLLFNAEVDPDALIGQPLYWNEAEQRFEPGLAKAELSTNGYASQGAQSSIIGLLKEKSTVNTGTILVGGIGEIDLSQAVDGTVSDGRYYLSGTEVGKLTKTRPGVAIPVCYKFGDQVLVTPTFRDFAEDHVHFSFELVARTAGTHVIPGPSGRHTITSPNVNLPGWLPAGHISFGGHAPAGAAFGYNLLAHPELRGVWPPIPVESARVIWDKGEDYVGGTEVPMGEFGLVLIDRYGIWWLSDAYGDVPWPTNYAGVAPDHGPSESIELPRVEVMRVILDFVRMAFATQHTLVTSLKSDDVHLSVTDCDGDPASTGDLLISLNLDLLLDGGDDEAGHIALKRFDPDSATFFGGPVLEGLTAGANVRLTGDNHDNNGVYFGVVRIDADVDANGLEFAPSLTRVDGMNQRVEGGLLYLSFMPGQINRLVGQVNIPPGAIAADTNVKLHLTLLGTLAGTIPDLSLSVLIVPAGISTPATVPSSPASVALNPSGTIASANQYFAVTSSAFQVDPGDTVFYTVTRSPGDGYSGEIGVIRQGLRVVA